jgi:hypothetical protein
VRLHGGPALRDGPGLVEDDGIDRPAPLQRLAALDEHAELRPAAGGDHHRGGHREPHRARARDDEHRHRRHQRVQVRRRRTEIEPHDEGGDGDAEHRRHEYRGHPVGQPLNRRLASLGLLHQPDDPREHRVGAHPVHPEAERAVPVERRSGHRIARTLRDRDRLAGEHGLVHVARPVEHDPVGRHRLARADQRLVARAEHGERYLLLATRADHPRGGGPKPDEAANGAGRLPPGPRLEQVPEQHQRDDPDHRLEVDVGLDAAHGEPAREQRDGRAVDERPAA